MRKIIKAVFGEQTFNLPDTASIVRKLLELASSLSLVREAVASLTSRVTSVEEKQAIPVPVCNNPRIIVISQSDYDKLTSVEEGVIYFIVEKTSTANKFWRIGDEMPATIGGYGLAIGDPIPLIIGGEEYL